MRVRNGASLIEVIVVLTIIAILAGIVIPAIQRVRAAAVQTKSVNNLKQIQLAIHNFASANDEKLPVLNGDRRGPNSGKSLMGTILPQIEQGAVYDALFNRGIPPGGRIYLVPQYISPADPTLDENSMRLGYASYAANAFAFQPGCTLSKSYADGTSNTIAFGEHYARCGNRQFNWTREDTASVQVRRASFSDGGPAFGDQSYGDVYPVTKGTPPVSGPAFFPVGPRTDNTPPNAILQPIKTPFQTAPRVDECHPLIAQTPHASGMLTALVDGSVRITAPGVSQATFWGAVTPAGGEILADW